MSHQIDTYFLGLILSERLPETDWDAFSAADSQLIVQLAKAEGVGPLLYWKLSQSDRIQLLPAAVRAALRAMYVSTKLNNEQILSELESLVNRFEQAGIPVVALKGICFALTIYTDIGLRPMVDLDLLVPASRSSDALQIARSAGYEEAVPAALPGLDELLGHAFCLKKTYAPYTTLELHHTLVAEESFHHSVPVDWFWSQTEPLIRAFPGKRFEDLRMLTPTAQLLYACAHALLQHGGRNTSLRWLYDLDRLICAYAQRIDWDLLLSQARTFEWSSAVFAALSHCVSCFDTPLPQYVLRELSKHADRNRERVAAMQAQPATHTLEEIQKLRSLSWYGRFKLILALVAPAPAYMRWRYGLKSDWALPAWYLYRWLGIGRDGMTTVGLLLRNKPLTRSPEQPIIKL